VVVERNPSLVLLLRHVERSAVQGVARARRDGCPDEPARAAGAQGQLQSDEDRSAQNAWDASGVAHRDAKADGARQLRVLLADVDAGKWAGQVPDGRAQGACLLAPQLAEQEQQDAAAPYTPDAAQSGARSCAVPEFEVRPGQRDAACSEPPASRERMR
jgi:hypothetical protein